MGAGQPAIGQIAASVLAASGAYDVTIERVSPPQGKATCAFNGRGTNARRIGHVLGGLFPA